MKKSKLAKKLKPFRSLRLSSQHVWLIVFAVVGVAVLLFVRAAALTANMEAENGAPQSGAGVGFDSTASAGKYMLFKHSVLTVGTLPPGSALPSDATCSARVSHKVEVRPQNATQNATAGRQKNLRDPFARVDGLYTGSTDDILQWVACKWGIDENIVRAQAAKESYWTQGNKGDWTTNASSCPPNHPLGVDGIAGQCPESYGILQNRWNYLGPPAGLDTWPEVETSTAFNADMTYASWRACFEGQYGWLNDVDHTGTYTAGDVWGCVGVWFAGRWKTDPANTYIQAVQDYYNQKIWEDAGFINYR